MRRQLTLLLLILLFLLLSLPASITAQETAPAKDGKPKLEIDPSDTPLVINGELNGQTAAFSGNMRLTITGGDVSELRLLPSDLRHSKHNSIVIDRSHITIPAGTALSDGQPRDVRVTVHNITRPGEYSAELKLLSPDKEAPNPLLIPLKLNIGAQPIVKPVSPNLTIQVVRCHGDIECLLATWLLPDSVLRHDWVVYLDNKTRLPVTVTDATVVMRGDKSGNAVTPNEIYLDVPQTLPENKIEPIKLTIERNRFSPDRYQGTVHFKVENSDEPIVLNILLNVRDKPFWAIVIILFGIFVGRLARSMETPTVRTQIKLMPAFTQLRAKAMQLNKDQAAINYVNQQVKTIKEQLNAPDVSEAKLWPEIKKLTKQIDLLLNLAEIESKLEKLSPRSATRSDLTAKIADARKKLIDGQIDEAQKRLTEIAIALQKRQQDLKMGEQETKDLVADIQVNMTELADTESTEPIVSPPHSVMKSLAWLLALVSGLQMNAEVRYWIVQPFLWLILLIVLLLLGLQTLYVNAGTTFGVAGVYDYLALFVWGLTADVASTSLINLAGKAGK